MEVYAGTRNGTGALRVRKPTGHRVGGHAHRRAGGAGRGDQIVASPCAVVLATMPPLLSGIATAGRHGALVKSAIVMEQLGQVDRVVFDKTGILTEGAPEVTVVRVLPSAGLGADDVLALAAATERPSEHPLGHAVVTAATRAGLVIADPDDFRAHPGRGVTATVQGRTVTVGTADPADVDPDAAAIDELRATGDTAVVITVDGTDAAVLGLRDRLRATAADAVAGLTGTTGRDPVLVTGDHPTAAARVAERVGIRDVRAGLLPTDKVRVVYRLQERGEHVLVVGDGINDAPALAAADAASRSGIVAARTSPWRPPTPSLSATTCRASPPC